MESKTAVFNKLLLFQLQFELVDCTTKEGQKWPSFRRTHRCIQIYSNPLRRCRRRRPATETGVSGRPIILSSSFTELTLLFLLLKFFNSSGYFIWVNSTLGQ